MNKQLKALRQKQFQAVFMTHGLNGEAPNPSNSGVNYQRAYRKPSKRNTES